MKNLSNRQLALVGLAVDKLIDSLETEGDEMDERDIRLLREASEIIHGEIVK